jgi:hypothetical protein
MSCEILHHVLLVVTKWEDLLIYPVDGGDEFLRNVSAIEVHCVTFTRNTSEFGLSKY